MDSNKPFKNYITTNMKTDKFSSIPALLIVLILIFSGCSATKKTAGAGVEGTWEYAITGAPQGDVHGNMMITKVSNVYKGTLNLPDGTQTDISNLAIVKKVLTGKFEFSNMTIDMTGTFETDKYTGTVSSQGYSFPMTATKKK